MHAMHLPLILMFMFVMLFSTTIAQDAPPSYGPAITLEQAKKVAAAAETEAHKNKWNVYIVVVDSGTNLVLMQRMDDAQLGSLNVATKKAITAAAFKRSTKVFEDGVAAETKRLLRKGKPQTLGQRISRGAGVYSRASMYLARAGENFNADVALLSAFDLYRSMENSVPAYNDHL